MKLVQTDGAAGGEVENIDQFAARRAQQRILKRAFISGMIIAVMMPMMPITTISSIEREAALPSPR